jgi:16S rRNA (uracil1498-N3)-methyltransferase
MSQLPRLVISPDQQDAERIVLTPDQHHYLRRVLRLGTGDRFLVLDGQGTTWLAVLEAGGDEARVVASVESGRELPFPVTLLTAMPKGNSMDDMVRQATEIGVTRIVPVQSDRTLLSPSAQKLERWRRISREAAEQSERQVVPEISDPLSWRDVVQAHQPDQQMGYLCVARSNCPHLLAHLLEQWRTHPVPIAIAIGPEGGWTEAEIEQGIAAGFHLVSLGDSILRATTAPTVALGIIASVMAIGKTGFGE